MGQAYKVAAPGGELPAEPIPDGTEGKIIP